MTYTPTRLLPLIVALILMMTGPAWPEERDTLPLSAWGTLDELSADAHRERRQRTHLLGLSSASLAIAGIGLSAYGESDYALLAAAGSVATGGAGLILNHYPTRTERARDRVADMDDAAAREQRSLDALYQLARQNRARRFTTGTINLGAATYYLVLDDSGSSSAQYSGLFSLASALANFLIKTPAERALEELQTPGNTSHKDPVHWNLDFSADDALRLSLGINF